MQKLIPFIEDKDRVSRELRDTDSIKYIKLHGCIMRSSDVACPLILTKEDYGSHRQGRQMLFEIFEHLAHEYPIIFVGHSLEDQDLRDLLANLRKKNISMPKSYMLVPHADKIQKDAFQKINVEIIEGTFEEFLNTIDAEIPSGLRGLKFEDDNKDFPILSHFRNSKQTISDALKRFIINEIDYVNKNIQCEFISPNKFYRGFNLGWSPIKQDLDVKRKLSDDILLENILYDEVTPKSKLQMLLIKAHAGAGKSIFLKRLAWDSACEYLKCCLFLKEYGELDINALKELLTYCDKKIYLFIDNASRYLNELNKLVKLLGDEAKKLTVIMTERTNIWNNYCEDWSQLPIQNYDLKYLNYYEADELINLLDKNKSLGELVLYSKEQQRKKLLDNYGKQLLVVLYEITHGKTFEEIIKDEYNNIPSATAKNMYLTVCILNRLKVPVRAGVITSIYNITYSEFNSKFYAPLEEVVIATQNPIDKDYYYHSRHPYIAEIVFNQVLSNSEDRYHYYVEALRPLNILYDTDRVAFREMIKARKLIELFNNHQMILQIYNMVDESYSEEPYVLQQKAIYEMLRINGNIQKAKEYLAIAESIDPRDLSIKHSKAELFIRMSDNAKSKVEFESLLSEAYKLVTNIFSIRADNLYCYSTLIKIELKRLKYYLSEDEYSLSEPTIREIINNIENNLFKGLQQFPSDSYLLNYDAELASLLNDSKRLIDSLNKVFTTNPRSSYIAMRLIKHYQENKEFNTALDILNKAIEANRAEQKLHYAKAKILFELDEEKYRQDILYHLSKSFVSTDKNYEAKILYGRELFINKQFEDSRTFFLELESVYVDSETRNKVLYPLNNVFYGKICAKDATYCFINLDDPQMGDVFAYHSYAKDNIWEDLDIGDRVSFKIGFTMRGASAIEIEKIM